MTGVAGGNEGEMGDDPAERADDDGGGQVTDVVDAPFSGREGEESHDGDLCTVLAKPPHPAQP